MAINIKFDLIGNPEPPTIILANRNGNKLGQLKVNTESIELSDKFNDASEFSFTINKYIDDELTYLWDKVIDFKLVYCKEWDEWFEIKVELDESTETIKTVFCTQLGQAELSQIMLYNIEINTEEDIKRDDYDEDYPTLFYRDDHTEASLLHRLLKDKAPHYSIVHVDSTIANEQRTFSFDSTSIYDAFQEVAEEIGCLFVYHSYLDENKILRRTIAVYDLQQYCSDCKHRGEFTDICPKCGSQNIISGYGEDTGIFVSNIELATEGIELVTDTDSVKNCFKLEAGDDLMTATVRNCNPNGTDYIWYFSDAMKEDMSDELVEKLESYDEKYKEYYNNHVSNLDAQLLNKYNSLVNKYSAYNKDLQTISSTIKGYPSLMNAYYNTIDLALYLESGLMPSVEMSETSAEEQLRLLTSSSLSPVAVNVEKIANVSLATANSAVLSMARIIVKSTYKVEIKNSSLSNDKVWTGRFIVTNYSDEEDTAENGDNETVSVVINNDTEAFIRQKIDKALNKENTDDLSISGLFDEENYSYNEFCDGLKKYALNPLKSFYDACEACLSILIDQGAGSKDEESDDGGEESEDGIEKPDLYEKLYLPYFNKSIAIANEIKIRENEIAIIKGVYDESDEKNPILKTRGLETSIEECRNAIQSELDFEKYLGEVLWLEFCTYRREDKYSNDNYISDGLNNAEVFERALEFIDVAENEIFKSAELQHSISTTLNNLLAIPKFRPLVHSFNTGNWIRVQIDDEIYRLRLLEYGISFGDFNNISVEFSDVTKIKNGVTDLQSVFNQASSMATSYSSVQRQASQGTDAKGTISDWLSDGLNSANVRIQSNDSEDITLTRHGLLARSYDDITETYSPEQFRLTHNIMAYTDDNWRTVKQAIGKHDYKYWDAKSKNFADDTGYGMSAKFAQAAYVIGSQFIGGEIISYNYVPNTSGTYFNLIDGDFDIAGGRFVYNKEANQLSIKDVNIDWSSSTNPDITYVVGLEDSINGLSSRIEINKQSITSEVARATKAEGTLSSQITQTAEEIRSEVTAADGNLQSQITQNAESITSEVTRATGAEDELSSKITQTAESITSEVNSVKTTLEEDYSTTEEMNSVIEQTASEINLEVSKKVGSDEIISKINQSAEEICISASKIKFEGLVTANNNFQILTDGSIEAKNANITGIINATAGGNIGGWYIGEDYIQGEYVDGSATYATYYLTLNSNPTINGNWIEAVCEEQSGDTETRFSVSGKGILTAKDADITGTINATSGSFTNGTISDLTIKGRLSFGNNSNYYIDPNYNNDSYYINLPELKVNDDGAVFSGTLSAAKGEFEGKITATSGYISGWEITGNHLKYDNTTLASTFIRIDNGSCYSSMSPNGITLYDGTNQVGLTGAGFGQTTWRKVQAAANGYSNLQSSVATLQTNVSTLQYNVSILQSKTSTLDDEIAALTTRILALEEEVGIR